MPKPISLHAASLAALRDPIKDEVAAAVRSPAPKARERAPPLERKGELLEIISQPKDTIRDLRQELEEARSLRRDGDSPSRPTPSSPSPYSPSGEQKASYAAALKSNPKPGKSQRRTTREPHTASGGGKLVSKYACIVVQGRANYTDDDKKALGMKQIAAGKKVSNWPVAKHSACSPRRTDSARCTCNCSSGYGQARTNKISLCAHSFHDSLQKRCVYVWDSQIAWWPSRQPTGHFVPHANRRPDSALLFHDSGGWASPIRVYAGGGPPMPGKLKWGGSLRGGGGYHGMGGCSVSFAKKIS